ncbi:MAG: glycoside hydrolase family 78 protein [Verrucomicrobiae bacterium]|nr:glycoside hydrolase family 78 protein [Verrucomicrobiae bacterium]
MLLACSGLLGMALSAQAIDVQNQRCEYLNNPMGIDAARPRLSWTLVSDQRGDQQTAYQILVASSADLLHADKGDLWDSGKVESDESTQIIFQGQPLASRQACFWKVRVWDSHKHPSDWSPAAQWQMGLLKKSDWTAQWIMPAPPAQPDKVLVIRRATYEDVSGGGVLDVTERLKAQIVEGRLQLRVDNKTMGVAPTNKTEKFLRMEYTYGTESFTNVLAQNQRLYLPVKDEAAPYLRRTFVVKSPVKHAVLYATALGLYEARINGQRVGDHLLAPDWTDYRQRVRYQAYDVSALVKPGENVIGALLAEGWFSGRIGNGGFEFFGGHPALLAQLELTYGDGSRETIATDTTWKWHESPIMSADFMLGESYDARKEIAGWDRSGLDDGGWSPVQMRDESARKLESQVMEPVRELCELKPKSMKETASGHWTYDLGQNMVGVVRLKVSAPAGQKITLRHAEMLNPDGTIYTTNLRGAPSIDEYICKGDGVETWEPRFTFHGFQYVEISGLANAPGLDAVTGIVIGSDTRHTGGFSCSDPRINQLQSNIQWGQRGNYLSVPTDCPQRDERLGWMGDAEVFIRTATYNADVAAFFSKWLVDVDDGQSKEGAYGDVSPFTMGGKGTPAWADAGVICPWTIYETYGDKRILEQHLPAMTRWVEFVRTNSNHLIRDGKRGNDYGDWLAIGANTPKELIGTAFFAYSTHLLAKSYHALGRNKEAGRYDRLFSDIKTVFNKHYVSPDGHIKGNTQCAYAMALKFELLPEELRAKAAQYLVADIKSKTNHLSTGFVGVSYLLPVLAQTGNPDVAYQLLLQDTFPSWLFSVKHGATTIWERWDGWTPEKGFQNPSMNSFNHYSLGSCGEFLFGGIGGIQPASPGFKKIRIEPVICDGLTWANASFDSIHGVITSAWKRKGSRLTLNITVPVNTTATVCLPATSIASVTESGGPVARKKAVKFLRFSGGSVELGVGSGNYQFAVDD